MMKQIIILFTFLFIGSKAQDVPVVSKCEIQFYVDWASFRGNDDKTIQELNFMTFTDQFQSSSDTFAIDIQVNARDSKNRKVIDESWTTHVIVPNDSLRPFMNIIDEFRSELLPDNYKFEVNITDPITKKSGEAKFNIEVPDISEASVSTIKFTTSHGKTKTGDSGFKANPSRRYGILNPILSVFYEFYSWDKASDNIQIRYSIIDQNREVIKKLPSASVKNKREDMAISHGFDVSNMKSGIYELKINISDDNKKQLAELSRSFEIIQYDYAKLETVISEEEAEEAGRLIKILSPAQFTSYNNLNLQGKAEYIINYWKALDPDPSTSENEYLKRIQQRYHYANQNFNWGKEQGWESDRGRVLIQYGNPDEISRHHSEKDTAPYEIWYYSKEKNYMFVFADMQSNGRFVLVHSNKEGEVRNSYWKNSLLK